MSSTFTEKQGRYLSFIHTYTLVNREPPAEADLARYFGITPPSAHQMVVTLEKRGLISREPGKARTIVVLVPTEQHPPLGKTAGSSRPSRTSITPAVTEDRLGLVVETVCQVVTRLFEKNEEHPVDDSESAPIVRVVAEVAGARVRDLGGTEKEAREATARVEEHAIELYVRLCARHDPENANVEVDGATFRFLMEYGRWPRSKRELLGRS